MFSPSGLGPRRHFPLSDLFYTAHSAAKALKPFQIFYYHSLHVSYHPMQFLLSVPPSLHQHPLKQEPHIHMLKEVKQMTQMSAEGLPVAY